MSAIGQEIVSKNTREIFRQLVEGCVLNISHPVPGRADGWAGFAYDHPDYCNLSPGQALVFMYDINWTSDQPTLCADRWRVTAPLGVKMSCQNWKGEREYFEDLWQRIRFQLSNDNWKFRLPIDISTTDHEGDTQTQIKPTFARLGIHNLSISGGSSLLRIDGGKILQYQGLVSFDVFFNAVFAQRPISSGVEVEPEEGIGTMIIGSTFIVA